MTNIQESQHGLVVSYFGNSVAVETQAGQVIPCQLHRNQELPVVGDNVLWQVGESNNYTIETILPRHSVMAKGDARGKMKIIAANVDVIVIVMAPPPIFSEHLIDRYLIAAQLLKIQPLILVNKKDLLRPNEFSELEERLACYEKVPYPILLTSVKMKEGLEELIEFLQAKTAVLIGPSGVGKSSIIAALAEEELKIGEVSAKGSGKHTTTATRLYHLPAGGKLIDSPGVRDFNLWPVSCDEIAKSFVEFNSLECRFRDCKHLLEPGCGIKQAVADGKISSKRYENYQALMRGSYAK